VLAGNIGFFFLERASAFAGTVQKQGAEIIIDTGVSNLAELASLLLLDAFRKLRPAGRGARAIVTVASDTSPWDSAEGAIGACESVWVEHAWRNGAAPKCALHQHIAIHGASSDGADNGGNELEKGVMLCTGRFLGARDAHALHGAELPEIVAKLRLVEAMWKTPNIQYTRFLALPIPCLRVLWLRPRSRHGAL